MAKRITMNGQSRKPLVEVFDKFVIAQTVQGLSETTLLTMRTVFVRMENCNEKLNNMHPQRAEVHKFANKMYSCGTVLYGDVVTLHKNKKEEGRQGREKYRQIHEFYLAGRLSDFKLLTIYPI